MHHLGVAPSAAFGERKNVKMSDFERLLWSFYRKILFSAQRGLCFPLKKRGVDFVLLLLLYRCLLLTCLPFVAQYTLSYSQSLIFDRLRLGRGLASLYDMSKKVLIYI
jgi:hypothetical protein